MWHSAVIDRYHASQFAVSGLVGVMSGTEIKTENEAARRFPLNTKADDLEFSAPVQKVRKSGAKSTGKSMKYWGLANLVNATAQACRPSFMNH